MRQRGMKHALDLYNGSTRRRGAKLGIIIALLAVLPGLVAGTAYISGSSSGNLTAGTTNVAGAVCGWWKDTAIDTQVTASSISGIYASGGSVAPTSGTISVTANAIESTSYEYLVDEIVWGCESTPGAGTISVSFTIGSASVTGATMAVMELTNVEPDAIVNPTTTTGGAACATTPANLYLPAASATANIPATEAYTWNAALATPAAVSGCGSLATPTLGVTVPTGVTTDTGYIWMSFALITTTSTGLSASAAFTMGFTVTVV